jgi:hypothetical protein
MIRRTLAVLFEPGDVIELRAMKHRRCTYSGYYDDRDALVKDALALNKLCGNVYVTLNGVQPSLLARRANRCEQYADVTTADAQIVRRRWLPIDVDPAIPGVDADCGRVLPTTQKGRRPALTSVETEEDWRVWADGELM